MTWLEMRNFELFFELKMIKDRLRKGFQSSNMGQL